MALKFGPQWLRDLSDAGSGGPQSPTTPTGSVKFKLADYRYGREEMLSLFTENSPPPDQVRKHLTIFSKEIQKPMTMMPLTEDEQRLISQGFNSTLVLRAAGRPTGPPLRTTRGGGTGDRGRGRGRGRGEGYVPRTMENGDIGYQRSTQDGWEHVGRKFERSFSRGYEETGSTKQYSRSSSDNWRDKRHEDEEDDDGGATWRNSRWGPSSRSNWRDPREGGYENERRPSTGRRGFDQDSRGPRRYSESADNDEVPEWVEDDIEDDPGTFDSKGVFVSTKENKQRENKQEPPPSDGNEKKKESPPGDTSKRSEKTSSSDVPKAVYVPPHKAQNGLAPPVEREQSPESRQSPPENRREIPDSTDVPLLPTHTAFSKKGDGDSGFAFPTKKEVNGTRAPPGQYAPHQETHHPNSGQQEVTVGQAQHRTESEVSDAENFSHVDKSLQNLVAEIAADTDKKCEVAVDVSEQALPLTHENAHKWFYRDPQGEVQGPFSNEDMAQWFSAGYFTMSLIVKRGCDDTFKQLGELIKRYNRVPFHPGPPLPPLVTSTAAADIPSSMPPLISPLAAGAVPTLVGAGLPGMQTDPLAYQQLLLQQEYLKQTFLLRTLQMQTLAQVQEQESFKGLSYEQQQHLAMQMTMQANPVTMQQIQHIQQQQLLTQQQQQQQQQQKQNEQQRLSPPSNVPLDGTSPGLSIPSSMPMSSVDSISSSSTPLVSTPTSGEPGVDEATLWGRVPQQQQMQAGGDGGWSQPSSLWDVTPGSENMTPAYQAQLEKLKKDREEARLKELKEERLKQEEFEQKQAELRRQQEELEQQREQMRREKEDLDRQKMEKHLELQKIEEARRREEERLRREEEDRIRRLEEERQRQELERQRQEEEEEERLRQEELMRQEEEEKLRREKEKELRKQEEKRKREDTKKKQVEEQKRLMEELQKKEEQRRLQEEMLRLQEQQRQEEERILRDESERERQREEEERQRLRMEEERERQEAVKRQQAELQRQQESLRRLQQAQQAQLANIQLPAASNWAAQQQAQSNPKQSKSLMEIQAEEARREKEREMERMNQMQQQQERTLMMGQQQLQKSWATHASQNVPKGPSLLDIQQQEQEISRKTNKEKHQSQSTYQTKLTLGGASTWSNPPASLQQPWSAPAWDSSPMGGAASIWGDQPSIPNRSQVKKVKESGEFPALRTPAQSGNKTPKANKKNTGGKKKTEEETVQKLFQQNQKSDSFSDWVSQKVAQFSAPIDVPTFVSFIVEVDNPEDVKDYMKTYLGDTRESNDFARQFIEKRSSFRNQARLEKQQEEDSIWGPAPAINPYIPGRGSERNSGSNLTSNTDQSESGSGKSKNKKKKQKMQKLDGSVLGFTVHSDPNRKNAAGELESVQ